MKNLFIILFLFLYIPSLAEEVYPHNNESFSKAKKLMKKVYYDNQVSFYCGCAYEYKQIKGKRNLKEVRESIDYWQSKVNSLKHGARLKYIEQSPIGNKYELNIVDKIKSSFLVHKTVKTAGDTALLDTAHNAAPSVRASINGFF